MDHQRLGVRASIPAINRKAQMSIKADYDRSFRVRAAQLFNMLPADLRGVSTLDAFKSGLGRFLEHYPDTPPVTGHFGVNDNSLLSWNQRRTHSMQLS